MSTPPKRNPSARSLQYEELRQLYDRAFREWIEEIRRRQLIAGYTDPDRQAQTEANPDFTAAYLAVRQRRDTLAKFLITPQQAHAPYSHVQDAAYFIWLNAGCPSGTSASDWFSAQKQLSAFWTAVVSQLAESPDSP